MMDRYEQGYHKGYTIGFWIGAVAGATTMFFLGVVIGLSVP